MSEIHYNLQPSNYFVGLTIRDKKQHEDIVKAHFKFHHRVIEENYLLHGQLIYISKFYDHLTDEKKRSNSSQGCKWLFETVHTHFGPEEQRDHKIICRSNRGKYYNSGPLIRCYMRNTAAN
jgi:hypothetical protein